MPAETVPAELKPDPLRSANGANGSMALSDPDRAFIRWPWLAPQGHGEVPDGENFALCRLRQRQKNVA